MRKVVATLALLLALFGSTTSISAQVISLRKQTDDEAFRTRVAECKRGCVDIAILYLLIVQAKLIIQRAPSENPFIPSHVVKKTRCELKYMRRQLRDPDFFKMRAGGRWETMTFAEQAKWAQKRWGPECS